MFNTLFNIILKTKPGNTERRRRRRKKKNKEGTFTTIFAAGLTSSFLLRPTEVNLSDANKKPSSARVIAIYEFPVTVLPPSAQMFLGVRHEFLERVKERLHGRLPQKSLRKLTPSSLLSKVANIASIPTPTQTRANPQNGSSKRQRKRNNQNKGNGCRKFALYLKLL